MERGRRTSIGTAIFEHGGFVVDGGKNVLKENLPSIIFRQPFPQDWVFVVAVPNIKKGLTENEEDTAFKGLSSMPAEDAGRICRLTMMKLLPSLIERDIKSFGEALTQIQIIVGEQFAAVQGGRYSSSIDQEGIEYMQKLGAYGAGQSSWGPAFYGLTQKEEAKEIQLKVQAFLREGVGGHIFTAKANNKGVYIKVTK